MKKLALLFISVAFLACNEKPKGNDSKIYTEKAVSDFIRIHSDWNHSKGIEAETDEKFKHMMINLSNEADFLKDLPFELKDLRDTTISNETYKLGKFQLHEKDASATNSLLKDLDMQLLGLMHNDQLKLTLGHHYLLTGTVFKQGKRADVYRESTNNKEIYHLGRYTFFITAAQELK